MTLDRDSDVQAWQPGQVLAGKYELLEKIGAGGMGVVHAARRLSLGDIVAIKSILPDRTNPRNRARFLREARAVARIRHPNVVQVFDFGEARDGRPYMIMQYVDGPTLAGVLAETGALPIPQALAWFADVCKAIEAGHRRGVVHRDIKPGNVMLDRSDDGAQTVKVLDFGLASMADDDDQDHSRANTLVGTVAYMSPESIEHGAVSPASDVFALGVMLYEMITGEVPFRGVNAIGTIMAVCEGVYAPPSETIAGVPDAVSRAIAAALSRSPTDRPGSALELANLALGRASTPQAAMLGAHAGRRSFDRLETNSQASIVLSQTSEATEEVDLSTLALQDTPAPSTPTSSEGMALLGAAAQTERDPQRVGAAVTSTTFVGRRLELDTLLELLAAAARDEIPIAVVLGEPGMGRTRLLRRFGELARERGAVVFEGRFWGYDGDRVAAGETFTRMLDLGAGMSNPGIDRRSAFADLAARFEAAAEGRSLVLLLDDLQHAPSRDLEFLTYLVRGGQRAVPILVVASARSHAARSDAATELSRWLLQLAGLKARTTLTLGRLSEDELRAWLEVAFGRLRIHPRDLRRLDKTSAGNPYFLSELIRHLVAGERIHPVDGEQTWVCEPLSGDVLPEGVASAVADQLASLTPELRTILETAAVIGEHLQADVLARAAGLDDDALDELLDEAVARDLLVEQELDGADLRFRSATVQQVLYDRLGNRKRRKLHAAVVEALLELGHGIADGSSRSAKLLAWHFRAIADWRRAIEFGLHAARETLGRHDHDAAEAALEHVAVALSELRSGSRSSTQALLDPSAEASASIELLLLALGGSLDARVGRYAEGARRLREAKAQLERDAESLESGRASLASWLARQTQSLAHVDRPLAYLRFEVDLALARCHLGLGALDAATTVGGEALTRAQALTLEDSGGEIQRLAAEWDARVALGHALGRFGKWNEAIDVLAPIVDVDPRPQLRVLHVMALRERGWLAARKGSIADAQRFTDQARLEAAACREPLADYCVASLAAVTHAAQGDWRSAAREYRQALRLARALSLRRREMIEQANLALALVELGEHDDALTNMLSVRAICRELGDVASAADATVGLGKILRARGNLDEAIDSFRRGHEACAAVGRHEYAAIALFELGRCELLRRHWAAAREVLLLARDQFARLGSVHEWEVELALANATRELDDEPAALDHANAAHALLEARRRLLDPGTDANAIERVDRGLAEIASFVAARG